MPWEKKSLVILIAATMGIWGCTQNGPEPASAPERLRMLESKNVKLESDFQALAVSRDQLRNKLAATETQQQQMKADLERQLAQARQELEDARGKLAARTSELEATA